MDAVQLISGCVVWIPLMFWVVSLVGWMITGDIDWISGTIGVFLGLALGVIALVPPLPILSPLSLVVVVATMILYPFVRRALEHRELRSLDVLTMEKAYSALAQRANNPAARYKVAEAAWRLGLTVHAISVAESALAQLPKTGFENEAKTVQSWKNRPTTPADARPIECAECATPNPPGEVYCLGCGAPFLLDRVKRRFAPSRVGRRLIAAWIALVVILAGLPASTALPPLMAILTVLFLLFSAGYVLYRAFRPILEVAA